MDATLNILRSWPGDDFVYVHIVRLADGERHHAGEAVG
jgi:hypothetical protein